MIKIVQGNDFYLRVLLTEESIDISSAQQIALHLVSSFGKVVELAPHVIDIHEIKARVEGELACGIYGVEITGKLNGDDFRSFEVGQIEIVYTNAQADHTPTDVLSVETYDLEMSISVGGGSQVQADWEQEDESAPSYIKNKPIVYNKNEVDAAISEVYAELDQNFVYGWGKQVFDDTLSPQITLDTWFKGLLNSELLDAMRDTINGKIGYAILAENTLIFYRDPNMQVEIARVNLSSLFANVAYKSQVYTKQQTNELLADKVDVIAFDSAMDGKVDKENGKGLSEEDYSSAEKAKLGALPTKSELDAELESKVDSATLDNTLTDYVYGNGFQVFQQPISYDSTTGSANLDAAFKKQLKKELMKVGFAEVVSDIAFLYEDDTRTNLIAQIPLIAYALKSQTYTKAQVDDIVAAVKQFEYEVVAELPTASAATKGKIYLVPSSNPKTQNVRDEFITTEDNGVFAWEQIGTTTIDLSDYYNKHEVDTKLATKASVSNVYTKTQTDNKLKEKADVSDVEALETAMEGKASIGALSGMMSSPALSTLADGRQEFLANVNSPETPFRMVIPAPADVDKAYVDRHVEEVVKTYDVRMLEDGTITSQDADLDSAEIITRIEDKKGEDWLHVTITDTPSVDKFLVPRVNYHDTHVFFSGVVLINGVQKLYTFSLDSNNVLTCVGQIPVPADIAQVSQTIRKSDTLYTYDGGTKYAGQSGNLLTAPTWLTALDGMDLSVYKRLRFFLTPSTHSVGLSTNNVTAMIEVEVMLDAASITANMPYYSGGNVTICANNDNRLFSVGILVQDRSADGVSHWDFAVKTVSLYGTSSTDITDSYVYKIEGCYE